jgi:hypothetical protein
MDMPAACSASKIFAVTPLSRREWRTMPPAGEANAAHVGRPECHSVFSGSATGVTRLVRRWNLRRYRLPPPLIQRPISSPSHVTSPWCS